MAHKKYMGIENGLHKFKITFQDPKKSHKQDKRSHKMVRVVKKSDINEIVRKYEAIEKGVVLEK